MSEERLPKRDAREMCEALRIRALAICGEKWEAPATKDMMKEAADLIEELTARLADLRAKVEKLLKEWQEQIRVERECAPLNPERGRELLEHSADTYALCADELAALLAEKGQP